MSIPSDYGEPWKTREGFDDDTIEVYAPNPRIKKPFQPCSLAVVESPLKGVSTKRLAKRIKDCVNALAGVPDPAAHLANLNATIERWESELSAVMPPDFKDWFQNDKSEWPMVARQVIESLREREAFCMRVIEHCEDTIKTMNDALKEAHRIFGNLNHSQVVQRLCPDFAEVAELVRKSHDQHA